MNQRSRRHDSAEQAFQQSLFQLQERLGSDSETNSSSAKSAQPASHAPRSQSNQSSAQSSAQPSAQPSAQSSAQPASQKQKQQKQQKSTSFTLAELEEAVADIEQYMRDRENQ
jgi:uncharacterized protein involved in copper resistance